MWCLNSAHNRVISLLVNMRSPRLFGQLGQSSLEVAHQAGCPEAI